MFIAAAIKEAQLPDLLPVIVARFAHEVRHVSDGLPEQSLLPIILAGFLLSVPNVLVYWRMLRQMRAAGGRIRSDLLGGPDVFVCVALTVFLGALLLLNAHPPLKPPEPAPAAHPQEISRLQIISGSSFFVLIVAAILALLIGRNVNLAELFGFGRVRLLRGVVMAGGLILLAFPMLLFVNFVTQKLLGGHAEQQEMVKIFRHAAKTGDASIVWLVAVSAACIAPVTEEFIFRGYIYPVLKRLAGAVPAGLGAALLFAAIHGNALGFPGLTILALILTLTYEFTGSLLVCIFMHAWFNALSLLAMWLGVQHGIGP